MRDNKIELLRKIGAIPSDSSQNGDGGFAGKGRLSGRSLIKLSTLSEALLLIALAVLATGLLYYDTKVIIPRTQTFKTIENSLAAERSKPSSFPSRPISVAASFKDYENLQTIQMPVKRIIDKDGQNLFEFEYQVRNFPHYLESDPDFHEPYFVLRLEDEVGNVYLQESTYGALITKGIQKLGYKNANIIIQKVIKSDTPIADMPPPITLSILIRAKNRVDMTWNRLPEDLRTGHEEYEISRLDQSIGIEFVEIPGGTFEMGDVWGDGDIDERPVRTITVSDFRMSKYEISTRQFCAYLNDIDNREETWSHWKGLGNTKIKIYNKKCIAEPGYENYPVVGVDWHDAKAFAEWFGARLPTEAEWEYAARAGGKEIKFPWGNEFDGRAMNFADQKADSVWSSREWNDGHVGTAPVGSYPPNELGLFDMAGNVWEWCSDWYDEKYYQHSILINPKGPSDGTFRVLRGGAFDYDYRDARSTNRFKELPDARHLNVGFRIAMSR